MESEDTLASISKNYSIPNGGKMNNQLDVLETLVKVYETELPTMPTDLQERYSKYINSLHYAITVILMYRKLTAKLAILSKEERHDPEATETH